ncbi:Hsp20/alpha crystallin family protein [Chrysiogenes arsenatis]|uniref:Hsp20/alpha crystallin family protein n=1 Tax=Chrysiogenes arsenatis TaxID=309797 RepID=UPI0003FBCD43|nr:Hsp20/alpha crystallin family protein [Chrysiogenes arsenatis]
MAFYGASGIGRFPHTDDSLIQEYLTRLTGSPHALAVPALDIFEYADRYVLEIELPGGLKKEDISLRYIDRNLILTGLLRSSSLPEGASYIQAERPTGTFTRVIHLSDLVDIENTKMDYTLGILTITIFKSGEKTIEIRLEG